MTIIALFLVVVFMTLMLAAVAFVIWAVVSGGQKQQRRRSEWVRTAQARAPARPRPQTELDELLEHIESQLDLLYGERARLQRLRDKGYRLRGRMQRSANLRARLPQLDRILERLKARAERLDTLIGQYGQRREDMAILREGEAFAAELDAFESNADAGDPLGRAALVTEDLDAEAQRLMDIAEAEEELQVMLQA